MLCFYRVHSKLCDYRYLFCVLFSLQQLYLNNFKDCGYDNVSFIAGMTDRVSIHTSNSDCGFSSFCALFGLWGELLGRMQKWAIKERMLISMQRLPHTLFSSLILNPSVSSESASRQCGLGLMPARCHVWVEFVVDSRPACSDGFSPVSPVFLPPLNYLFILYI